MLWIEAISVSVILIVVTLVSRYEAAATSTGSSSTCAA